MADEQIPRRGPMTLQQILSSLDLPHAADRPPVVFPEGYCDEAGCHTVHACPRCHDTGRYQVGRARLVAGARPTEPTFVPAQVVLCEICNVPPAIAQEEYLAGAGANVAYHHSSLDAWIPETQEERLAEIAIGDYLAAWPPAKPFLLMAGNAGTGKTHLAAAILWEAHNLYGVRGRFEVVPDLLERMRATYERDRNDEGETIAKMLAWLTTVPMLVLDDLGMGTETAWVIERLYLIVNARYNARRPTVVTTNQRLSTQDQRLVTRLGDWRVSTVIPFSGRNRRERP